MATKTVPFDAASYLGCAEIQAEFLNDALSFGDAVHVVDAIGVIAQARGMAEIARGAGLTFDALYEALSSPDDLKLTLLLSVIRSLGFSIALRPARGRRRVASRRTGSRSR